ncbi:MAG: tetratricopeptide repeat protein [Armatimonadetes bacterium]|nr:tetratricopeptide repeat protein [Armatimonadota bacterium]
MSHEISQAEGRLHDLLEELRRAGSHDSEGRFTLDAGRARSLLREHQLADPEHWVLAVLTSAIAAGANFVEVHVDARGCRIQHDGSPLSRYELDNLFSWLLVRDRERQTLRDLALGVNAALNLQPESLVLHCFDGSRSLLGSFHEQGIRVEEEPADRPPGTVVELKRKNLGTPEAELIERCFPWSSVPIRVNGRFVTGSTPAGPWLGTRCLLTTRHERWLKLPAEVIEAAVAVKLEQAAPFSSAVLLGCAVPSALEFVLYGRSYVAPLPWDVPGLRVIVATDRLSRDLSQASLVENDVYQNLRRVIEAEVLQMLRDLAAQRERLDLDGAREAVPYLTLLADSDIQNGEREQAIHLLSWMRHVWRRLPPAADPLPNGLTSFKLALLAGQMGDRQQEAILAAEAEGLWANLRNDGHYFVDGERMDPRTFVRWQKAMAVERVCGQDHPTLLQLLEDSTRAAEKRYHYLEAERFQRWRLSICDRCWPADDPRLLKECVTYGRILVLANRFAQARPIFRQALGRYVAGGQGEPEVLSEIFVRLATIETELGNFDEAADLLHRCTALLQQLHGTHSLVLRPVLNQLAEILDRMGRGEEARNYRSWMAQLPTRTLKNPP